MSDNNTSPDTIAVDYDPFAGEAIALVSASTEAQKEIWSSLQMNDRATCAFNESVTLHFHGPLNVEVLKKSIALLVNRHEALRTTFSHDGENLCIVETLDPVINLIKSSAGSKEKDINKLIQNEAELAFDLEHGPLVRFNLLQVSNDENYLVISAHHIVCDGWSLGILLHELAEIYSAFDKDLMPELADAFAFSQYARDSESDRLNNDADEKYWVNVFAERIPQFELPVDKPRPAFRTFNSKRIDFNVDKHIIDQTKQLAASLRCSMTSLMMAAFSVCLYRWTGEDDLVIGIPSAAQPSYSPEGLVGHCVNLLPIHINVISTESFKALVNQLSDSVIDASEHQNYTFGSLLKKLPIKFDPSRIPLVPVLFNIDKGIQGKDLVFSDLTVEFYSNPRHYENFEIFINAADYGKHFVIECQYNTDLFTEASIRNRLAEYVAVLEYINKNQEADVSGIKLLSDAERTSVAALENQTDITWPDSLLVHQKIDQVAKVQGSKLAVRTSASDLGFNELAEKSNQFAHYLIEQGVTRHSLVGVAISRSTDMLIVLLGVLKAGATYVPLDPQFPADRIAYMIEDARLKYVVTQTEYADLVAGAKQKILVDDLAPILASCSTQPVNVMVSPDDLAYVIYTSGSTGKPKGVMVHHGAMINFLNSMRQQPGCSQNDVLLAVTTLSFDIAVLELYLPLLAGATVIVATKEESTDGNKLTDLITRFGVNIMQATPATWQMLIAANWRGSPAFKALCGGEALAKDLANNLMERCGELWNMYGPTETTVWSSCQKIVQTDLLSIGKPIANTQFYILDERLEPVPVGIAGELYIAGDGVTKGYLNKPELTAERFVADSFSSKPGALMYRTGDSVRRHTNHAIEYTGRLDNQVKVRGFRIELGEIETVIRRHPAVTDCALTVKTLQAGDNRLVAYIIWKSGEAIDSATLNRYLREWLPDYMLPQHVMPVESLPRTPNGKLDRKHLPDLLLDQQNDQSFVEPATETEKWLAGLWSGILSVRKIGSNSNFFELGGHSLLIAQLIQKIEAEKSLHLNYRDIFNFQILSDLAARIDEISGTGKQTIYKIPRKDKNTRNILALAQQRLWYLDKLNPGSNLYNLPSAFRFIGKFDKQALGNSFKDMIVRHDTLRTTFAEDDGEPVQKIHDANFFSLPETDISNLGKAERESKLNEMLDAFQSHVFNLEELPLFKAMLFKLGDEEYALFFMPHHAIFDGWSFDIFVHELTTGYCKHSGQKYDALPELPIQYSDYAVWLRDYLSGEELNKQLQYWLNTLQGSLPVLEMPLDKARPDVAQNKGEEIFFDIDAGAFEALSSIANRHGVSVFMLMFSIYTLLLYRYTGQDDIIIGAPMADRTRAGTENLIGFFVNALVLRITVKPEQSFGELLHQVREICLSGFANQDTPFEKLVETLNPERDFSHAPLFQTSLTYQDVSARELSMGDIEIQQIEIPSHNAPLDINLWLKRRGNRIVGAMVYSDSLFERQTIEQFTRHFVSLVKRVGEYQNLSLLEIPILSNDERKIELSRNDSGDADLAASQLLHELIDHSASSRPDAVAACCNGVCLKYSDLSQQSNQFANYLINQGVARGSMVGLCVDRSVNMLVALLGIMKSGAAYVPLDPEFPQDRISYMVQDAGLNFVVTESAHLGKLPGIKKPIVINDMAALLQDQSSTLANAPAVTADDIVYVIYTSGSTGNPKGVMVHHGAAVNFLTSMAKRPGLGDKDKLLAVTTLSFDIAVLELYLPLVVGGQVFIATKQESNDGRLMLALFKQHGITVMQATPVTWRMLIGSGWSSENKIRALCGGEALSKDLAADIRERCHELWNMYGPTETTVWSTCGLIDDAVKPLSIGTAIANTQIYILDEQHNPVPTGVAGELYIGGTGVTKGYLNRPELTAERFIDNPFTHQGKIYQTGDKARYRIDGALECLGRLDNQVKVRGYRIELGEIESAMRQHPSIKDCAVTVTGAQTGDARLVSFVVWESGQSQTVTEIRNYLREILPAYMIPQHLVELDQLPQTPNMKLDRKALAPLFTGQGKRDNYVEPKSESERWLADLWKKIIGIDRVGMHDNFFDLGGHSLLSMQVIHHVSNDTGVNLHPRDLLLEDLGRIADKIPQTSLPMYMNQVNNQNKSGIKNMLKNLFN
jgi:amino acid adenylation domain-containing protein